MKRWVAFVVLAASAAIASSQPLSPHLQAKEASRCVAGFVPIHISSEDKWGSLLEHGLQEVAASEDFLKAFEIDQGLLRQVFLKSHQSPAGGHLNFAYEAGDFIKTVSLNLCRDGSCATRRVYFGKTVGACIAKIQAIMTFYVSSTMAELSDRGGDMTDNMWIGEPTDTTWLDRFMKWTTL